ncbi:hypothetical protein PAP_10185 [Palaeococcus pacificus DY20341]|uniref:Uncharacterized protein n=1 Tax=Palaeococcus pacificus DY20341 TaxID=1343739 RepID=A0A075M0V1_9EURY|nr:hypothetical protein [Palaeococcus pacificus]AIF70408.1 hypothetical protein PAP_10185 [Palaeococcus pacificus DY20341]
MKEEIKLAFSYSAFRVGFILLILALLLSGISLYSVPKSYLERGTLYQNETKEFYVPYSSYSIDNVSLIFHSDNAQIEYYSAVNGTINVSGTQELTFKFLPKLYVVSGNANYTLKVEGKRYPLLSLSYISFVAMISGIVLVLLGYSKFLGEAVRRHKK